MSPIILPVGSDVTVQQADLTAQAIINSASQDVRQQLASSGTDANIFLDWINRVQLTVLRASRWSFLLSEVQYFITERGRSDYWLGELGQNVAGTVDAGLDLDDLDIIARNSVVDASNSRVLRRTQEKPFSSNLSTRDAQFRTGLPAEWRQDYLNPNVLSIFPAPNNQNSYQPQPESPYLTTTPGGALAQRTYYVQVSFVDSLGNESTPCDREAIETIPVNQLVKVQSPVLPEALTSQGVRYSQYRVYASTVSNSETLQATVAMGTDWTEPASGLIVGVTPPTVNNLTTLDGYIIAFRYFKQRQVVANVSDVLQVPDVYKDIIVAGVMHYATLYLRLQQDAMFWLQAFNDGLRQMVRDANLFPKENDFIQPDAATLGIGSLVPYLDTFDLTR